MLPAPPLASPGAEVKKNSGQFSQEEVTKGTERSLSRDKRFLARRRERWRVVPRWRAMLQPSRNLNPYRRSPIAHLEFHCSRSAFGLRQKPPESPSPLPLSQKHSSAFPHAQCERKQ